MFYGGTDRSSRISKENIAEENEEKRRPKKGGIIESDVWWVNEREKDAGDRVK